MPNVIKYSVSAQTEALKKGNFWIGTGDVGKGPTSSSDYWQGIAPPSGGYTIYLNKATQGPSIYSPTDDSSLITLTNMIGSQSFTSVTQCFNWYNTQSDKMVFNKDYPAIITSGIVSNMDATFLPSYSTSGTTWYDLSPTGNNATLTNGPTYSSSENGSIVFDGTNDYAVFTRPSTIVTSGAISIAIWVKWTTVGTTSSTIQALVDNNHSFNNGFVIQDRPDISKYLTFSVRPTVSNPNGVVSTFQVGNGRWHYIVGTNDLTTSRLYIDGYLNAQAAESGGIINAQPNVSVGYWQAGPGRYLNGNVKQVSLYNRALSSAEILQNFYGSNIVTSGLVLYLDAGNIVSYPQTGTAWYDISGNNQNFTLYNSPTFSNSNGGEILFSNSNDYARITNSTSIDLLASNGTIEVWFRTISSTLGGTYARLISFSDASGTGSDSSSTQGLNRDYDNYLCLVKNNTAESLGLWYKNNPSAFGPATLVNTNTYFHSVISWSTNGSLMTFTFYLNGVSTNTSTVTQSAYSSNASTITIGQNCAGALTNPYENSSCAFSSLKLYNRALTAQEVSQNYNAQKSRFGL